ncbi:hypothetical protein C8Q76DRAFT_797962 [Earliella scabrosa]|nr:hypothetical protein C8Q76DRAFT_797962 [Earliella scabrosa]
MSQPNHKCNHLFVIVASTVRECRLQAERPAQHVSASSIIPSASTVSWAPNPLNPFGRSFRFPPFISKTNFDKVSPGTWHARKPGPPRHAVPARAGPTAGAAPKYERFAATTSSTSLMSKRPTTSLRRPTSLVNGTTSFSRDPFESSRLPDLDAIVRDAAATEEHNPEDLDYEPRGRAADEDELAGDVEGDFLR